jgi:hypothetical protein
MRPQRIILPALLAISCGTAASAEFADHPGAAPLHSAPSRPKLDTPKARKFRTQLKEQSALGPNLSGHYRLVTWGCGSGCLEWAVVDLTNGKVWMGPTQTCAEPRIDAEGTPRWAESRADSAVVHLYECQMTAETACPESRQDRRHSYRWTGRKLEDLGIDCVGADPGITAGPR